MSNLALVRKKYKRNTLGRDNNLKGLFGMPQISNYTIEYLF